MRLIGGGYLRFPEEGVGMEPELRVRRCKDRSVEGYGHNTEDVGDREMIYRGRFNSRNVPTSATNPSEEFHPLELGGKSMTRIALLPRKGPVRSEGNA